MDDVSKWIIKYIWTNHILKHVYIASSYYIIFIANIKLTFFAETIYADISEWSVRIY